MPICNVVSPRNKFEHIQIQDKVIYEDGSSASNLNEHEF